MTGLLIINHIIQFYYFADKLEDSFSIHKIGTERFKNSSIPVMKQMRMRKQKTLMKRVKKYYCPQRALF